MPFSTASILRLFATALIAWAFAYPARAATTPLSYALDFPIQPNLATPEWLGHPAQPSGNFASLDLPLISPEAGASLLVTINFREKDGGFLRLSWKGANTDQVLSNNFYEGVAMDNQRTLLIPASVVQGGGTLILQVGDTVLGVQRISLEWMEEHTALVSPERPNEEVVSRLGKEGVATDLDGGPAEVETVTLDGAIVSVPVTSTPQRIDQGVEFGLQLEGVPRAARLSFEESGLAWGRHLVLWINQQRAGTITPDVPDLRDAGFPGAAGQAYVGWRRGAIYLPVAMLKTGLNAIQLSVENDAPGATDDPDADLTGEKPLALTQVVCQFDYTATQVLTPVTATSAPASDSSPMLVPTAPDMLTLKQSPPPIAEERVVTPNAASATADDAATTP